MTAPRKLTLFRYPMGHSFSPLIHQEFADQCGISLTYDQTEVSSGHFMQALLAFRQSGGYGANVTMPLKEEAFLVCQKHTPRSLASKTVNTLWWDDQGVLWGDNTDGFGFIRDLTIHHQQSVAQAVILLIGAGGAARGVLSAILACHPKKIFICNRTITKVDQLKKLAADRIELFDEMTFKKDGFTQVDLFIHATPADIQTLIPSALFKESFVYQLSYSAIPGVKSDFAKHALNHGARQAVDGLGMLVEQAAESFRSWFPGSDPDTSRLLNGDLLTFSRK